MGRLHCTQGPVPEAVGGDMQQLNQLGAQVGRAGPAGRPKGAPGGAGRLASGALGDPARAESGVRCGDSGSG